MATGPISFFVQAIDRPVFLLYATLSMFTGIITAIATVKKVTPTTGGLVVAITTPVGWKLRSGASIAVNGVCSTVKKTGKTFVVEYMPESLVRSAIGSLVTGDWVNLEQSLCASDRLDGHIVLGHVDTVGKITALTQEGNSSIFRITIKDKKFLRLIAEKGSVAVDGISLTVTAVGKIFFEIKMIPFTLAHTAFSNRAVGDLVNVECDVVARYLARLIKK